MNAHWAATLISKRGFFFSSFFNLSGRAAVNFSHQQGGQLGEKGSWQRALSARYSELSGNILHGAVEELFRTSRFLCFHRNDSQRSA